MRCYAIVLLLCSLLFSGCGQKKTNTKDKTADSVKETKTSEWISLFNGENLNGWTMKINGFPLGENFGNTFRVKNNILSIRYDAYGNEFGNRFGALYYKQKLKNYRLRVTYRFVGETAPGAPEWGYRDSGIQFHGQSPQSVGLHQAFPTCLEYNLHGGNGTDERPVGQICAIGMFVEFNGEKNTRFCTPPTVGKTFHGDQWVTAEIEVIDGTITHFVNGEEILQFENPSLNPNNDISKALIKNGELSISEGYISLQSNSHPIDFKSIELLNF